MQHIDGEECDTALIQTWGTREVLLDHTVAEESRYIPIHLDSYSSTEPIQLVAVAV